MNIADEVLEILLDFGGAQGGRPGDIAVRFLLPSFFWTVLAFVAFREWRRTGERKDRFIGIAAVIGLFARTADVCRRIREPAGAFRL